MRTGCSRVRVLLVASALLVLRSAAADEPPAPPPRPNIVLIVVDTLRADRLRAYSSIRNLTPFLDTLTANGAIFERAYAQSSWTAPSVGSLITSRFQSQHGVVSFWSGLDQSEVTLAETLQQAGYATGGFVANPMLNHTAGFAQGFDEYREILSREKGKKARAAEVNLRALRWLDRTPGRPVFLSLHYMEPHLPYDPPPPALTRAVGLAPPPKVADATFLMMMATNTGTVTPAARRTIEQVYDAEVTDLDDALRVLFEGLIARRILHNAIVVLTADHGEEFTEHGAMGHGSSLYDELIRVPLVIAASPAVARRRVPDVVSLIDVAPTLLEMTGIPIPPSFQGRSLRLLLLPPSGSPLWSRFLALLRRPEPAPIAYSELIFAGRSEGDRKRPHVLALVQERAKLILGVKGEHEAYDLARDPAEEVPLPDGDAHAKPLRAAASDFVGRMRQTPRGGQDAVAVDAEQVERLRALGYVQ